MLENQSKTAIADLGEFGLIKHLTDSFELTQKSSLKGIGDDAAIIDAGDHAVVVSTDLLLEGIHFDLMYMPLAHLGFKAVSVNVSDICAMNAEPTQITVSIGLSSKFTVEAVEELYRGIRSACAHYKVDLIGGDTTASKQGLVVSVTALGKAPKESITYRSGAGQTDLLCVTGDLGGAYVGYQLLEREKRVFMESPDVQPDLEGHDYIVGRQLKPLARHDIRSILEDIKVTPTSMIDISDGLASETIHLAQASDLGMKLYEDKLPIDPTTYQMAREFGLDPTTCALNGGEDYELLFTIAMDDFDKVKNHPDISVIGHCMDKNSGTKLVTKSDNEYDLKAQGWKSF